MKDYQGINYSYRSKLQKRKKFKKIRFLFILIVIMSIASFIYFKKLSKIKQIYGFAYKVDTINLDKKLSEINKNFILKKAIKELAGVNELLKGNIKEAENSFNELKEFDSPMDKKKMLKGLIDNALYKKAEILLHYFLKNNINNLENYQGLINASLYKGSLSDTKNLDDKEKKFINSYQDKQNNFKLITDRNSKPIATYSPQNDKITPKISGFDFSPLTKELKKGIKVIKLTLDKEIQNKVESIFTKHRGTMVLISLKDGSIISAYSSPENNEIKNDCFSESYEPGSIIKMITLYGHKHYKKKDIFPFYCKGNLNIEGKIFYDWWKHEDVKNAETATALSCNSVFATMGMNLRENKLRSNLKSFFFNKTKQFSDLPFTFKTGKFNENNRGKYYCANLSVGLEEIDITTIHSAIIAEIIAMNGKFYPPHIIHSKKNLLGHQYYVADMKEKITHKDNYSFAILNSSMKNVVNYKYGTGRRAKNTYSSIAMKTGTAGDKKTGLDAIIIAYFPADKPEFALGLRLKGAGKCEIKGALFVKELITQLYEDK